MVALFSEKASGALLRAGLGLGRSGAPDEDAGAGRKGISVERTFRPLRGKGLEAKLAEIDLIDRALRLGDVLRGGLEQEHGVLCVIDVQHPALRVEEDDGDVVRERKGVQEARLAVGAVQGFLDDRSRDPSPRHGRGPAPTLGDAGEARPAG